jgi:hypothetical protein
MAKGDQPGCQIPELAWEILVNQQKMHWASIDGCWTIEGWSLRLVDQASSTNGSPKQIIWQE